MRRSSLLMIIVFITGLMTTPVRAIGPMDQLREYLKKESSWRLEQIRKNRPFYESLHKTFESDHWYNLSELYRQNSFTGRYWPYDGGAEFFRELNRLGIKVVFELPGKSAEQGPTRYLADVSVVDNSLSLGVSLSVVSAVGFSPSSKTYAPIDLPTQKEWFTLAKVNFPGEPKFLIPSDPYFQTGFEVRQSAKKLARLTESGNSGKVIRSRVKQIKNTEGARKIFEVRDLRKKI